MTRQVSAYQDLETGDHVGDLQGDAIVQDFAPWGHWGANPNKYTAWNYHSNRLIPCYVFGSDLSAYTGANSAYRSEEKLKKIYGQLPAQTVNPSAEYFDQTDLFDLQVKAAAEGKKYIIVMIFDGMDWTNTLSAAIVKTRSIPYASGRGTGLSFQDYRGTKTDYGFFCCSATNGLVDSDLDRQKLLSMEDEFSGGYNASLGGATPWDQPASLDYLIGKYRELPHMVTESPASATSIMSGIKSYNHSVNIDVNGNPVEPIARILQKKGFGIGVVTSVSISHATPAAAYSNNVGRSDYQDVTRDLLGLPSVIHPSPLPGVDVLLGAGWGAYEGDARKKQGKNYVPGNPYITETDLATIDVANGGAYLVAQRTPGTSGKDLIRAAAHSAAENDQRLFGFFGIAGDHLPYQTADGQFDPVDLSKPKVPEGENGGEPSIDKSTFGKRVPLSSADVMENPELADFTDAALTVLTDRFREKGFWLMVEAGEVDWANHNNDLDSSIGAIFSGEAAFNSITRWAEANNCWDETLVIVTADHGHLFVLTDPQALIPPEPASGASTGDESRLFPAK